MCMLIRPRDQLLSSLTLSLCCKAALMSFKRHFFINENSFFFFSVEARFHQCDQKEVLQVLIMRDFLETWLSVSDNYTVSQHESVSANNGQPMTYLSWNNNSNKTLSKVCGYFKELSQHFWDFKSLFQHKSLFLRHFALLWDSHLLSWDKFFVYNNKLLFWERRSEFWGTKSYDWDTDS